MLPFCRTTACLGILKEGSGNVLVTQSLCCVCVFLLNYEEFMIAIGSGVSLSARLLFCMFKI